MKTLAVYRKTIVAGIGALLTWAGTAYVPDGHVSRAELYVLAVALATAGGVYVAPNALAYRQDTAPAAPLDAAAVDVA